MKPFLARLPKPCFFAHRGGAGLAPENTLAAFDRGASFGADALELDVRLTRDGALVVIHDAAVDRTTDGTGLVRAFTLRELRSLDAGHRFTPGGAAFPFRGKGVRVPLLSEVFARYPSLFVNVEAKDEDEACARALVEEVRRAGRVDSVCIGSAVDAQGERIRALLPEAASFFPTDAATCHVLAAKSGNDGAGCPQGYDVFDLPLRHEELGFTVIDEAFVEYAHARGAQVHAWTVDDEADMRALLAIGADGIMTDRPDRLARVLGRR